MGVCVAPRMRREPRRFQEPRGRQNKRRTPRLTSDGRIMAARAIVGSPEMASEQGRRGAS
jgi:hypothetical protein